MNHMNFRIAGLAICLLSALSPLFSRTSHDVAAEVFAPCDPFTEVVFDNDICYGESDNFSRRLKLGPDAVPGAGEVVTWEVVSFDPAPGSDMSAFVGGFFTTADNSTTDTEFRLFNNGQTFRPEASPVGTNGLPLYGTYTLSVVVSNAGSGCSSMPFIVTKTIFGTPEAPSTVEFGDPHCYGEADNSLRRIKVGPNDLLDPDEEVVWEITNFIPGPGSDMSAFADGQLYSNGTNGTTGAEFLILSQGVNFRSEQFALGVNGLPIYGTYELMAYVQNTASDCISEGFAVSKTIAAPADPLDVDPLTMAFCTGASFAERSLQLPMGIVSSDEVVVWVVQSAPAASGYAAGFEFAPCGVDAEDDYFRALASNRRTLAAKNAVPAGTYVFKVKRRNCVGGCDSPLAEELFTITKYDNPSVEILADSEGDICLGTTGVMYEAVVTPNLPGDQSFAWCAYNSSDGSGMCFDGFTPGGDNATQMRDWTASAGPKSVGVSVITDVPGCNETSDLYSFNVDTTPMVECPGNQTTTLVTNAGSFDCMATASWTNPVVDAGGCGPITLAVSVDGSDPETVTPGETYTAMFFDLGVYVVTYTLTDVNGDMSECSFMVTVDGLPCGWVDQGGIGCADANNTSGFDSMAGSFTLSANNCAPAFPYSEDHTAYVFTEMCDDGEIIAHVTNVDGTGFAGVMIRDFLIGASPMAAVGTNRVNRVRKEVRTLPSYPAFPQAVLAYDQFWVRLVRTGNQIQGFASTDGATWFPYINQQIFFNNSCAYVGLYVYSEKPGTPITASFDNVMVNGEMMSLGGLPESTTLSQPTAVQTGFDVYPNPTSNMFNLKFEQGFEAAATIRLMNSIGQQVQMMKVDALNAGAIQLEVSDMEAGIYTISVEIGNERMTKRVVIAR